MIMQLDTNPWSSESSFNFLCNILDENGNVIKEYQAEDGFTNIDEYAESIYQRKADIIKSQNKTKEEWRKDWESRFKNRDFEFSLPFSYVQSKVDHLSFYNKDVTNEKQYH